MTNTNTNGPWFIVRRIISDGHNGVPDVYGYFKVQNPNPGELIYHGTFVPRQAQEDMKENGTRNYTVMVPVDASKVTSEPYVPNGGAAEQF